MKTAVVFDMDGVLVDSEVHWVEVEASFLGSFVGGWSEQDQQQIIGLSAYDVYAHLKSNYGLEIEKEEFLSKYFSLADSIYGEKCQLIPGALELAKSLSKMGVHVGLASSSPRQWVSIASDRFGFKDIFEVVCSSDDVGGVGKPKPDVYLHALKKMDCVDVPSLAIEDSSKGVAAAIAAGMLCVGFRNGFNDKQDLSKATLEVRGFSQISPEKVISLLQDV